MAFSPPPSSAAWQHRDARDGFEVVFIQAGREGYRIDGHTSAVEAGETWAVHYLIHLDTRWHTRSTRVTGYSHNGMRQVELEADGAGRWKINSRPASELDGLLDVDLEASAFTNAFPVHRLALSTGQSADAPAAYVRALDRSVQRMEQRYTRIPDDRGRQRYDYSSSTFGFACRLIYDESGLVADYPGIAIRVA
jgi:uncharacterized protein